MWQKGDTLIKQGANINFKRPSPYSDTALMRAAKFGRLEVVQVLLQNHQDAMTIKIDDDSNVEELEARIAAETQAAATPEATEATEAAAAPAPQTSES